jgi:hypothetical protein
MIFDLRTRPMRVPLLGRLNLVLGLGFLVASSSVFGLAIIEGVAGPSA